MQFKSGGGEEDSKNYVRLKDGESATGIFAGEIHEFATHWIGKQPEVCTDGTSTPCKGCETTGKRGGFRFRLNFIMKDENGNYMPRIFEQGWTVYKDMRALNDEYPLESTIVKIMRRGSGVNDTSYTILPIRDPQVKPDLAAKLKQVQLFDLRHEDAQPQKGSSAPSQEFSMDDIPF